jgi:ketosteroid isomerase-like protein
MRCAVKIGPTLALGALSMIASPAAADENAREVLQRQAQELVDALASGKKEVWEKYLDPGVRYVDEAGKVAGKKEMVDGVRALPAGVSGTIRVTEFDALVQGDVAVATYVDDEHETYHGHELHCQYRVTDTWKKTPQGWRLIGAQVLALRTDPPAIELPPAALDAYCGRYLLSPGITYEIRRKGNGLEGRQTGRKAEELRAEAPDVLFVPGRPRYRYIFRRDAQGNVTSLIQRREAWDLPWKREG